MATKRKWTWAVGTVLAVALVATAGILQALDPMLLPGSHSATVYALDDDVTEEMDAGPWC